MKKVPEIIKTIRRKLRDNQTPAEEKLWNIVRAKKIGYKFQRQYPLYLYTEDSGLDRYIICDFYCSEKKLIIELDGSIHDRKDIYLLDKYKEKIILSKGYTVFRFKNSEILGSDNLRELMLSKIDSLQPLALVKSEDSGESFKKRFKMINDSFSCENCKREIPKHPSGSARNHCPHCLYSKHLDKDFPGDRASTCHGLMKPVGKDYHKNKGWMVIHECTKCGKKIPNKLAEDDDVGVFGRL